MNRTFFKEHLNNNKYDIIIAVDKGLEAIDSLRVPPNYIVGDFDSIDHAVLKKYENGNIKIKRLVPEKDLTDTESAIRLAIDIKSEFITIIGATGTRLDHVLANINILKIALDNKVDAQIINENNEIQLVNSHIEITKNELFKYISIIPLTTIVKGVTLKGMKYPLDKYTLSIGNSLGISNEQLNQTAEIDIDEGILIVIRSKD